MCISMITGTVLNSMNREKATLINYFAGAAAMIACLAALTPLIGVYSYVAGLAASYVITAALNMRLLKKLCPGMKYKGYFMRAAVACVLSCTFGRLLGGILENFFPPVACLFAGGAATALFTGVTFLAFRTYSLTPAIVYIKGRLEVLRTARLKKKSKKTM